MSTKTTFKRIALVAVAALTLGSLSAVSATAAVQSDVLTLTSATSTATTGVASTNAITLTFLDTDATSETATATVAVLSSPATSTALPTLAITSAQATANTAGATSAAGLVLSVASPSAGGRATGSGTISLTPDVAGTYVIRVTPAGGLTTTAQTWTVTAAAPTAISAAGSTLLIAGSTTTPSTTTDVVAVQAPRGITEPVAANISVVAGNSTTADTAVSTETLSATVTGSGLIAWSNSRSAAARSVSAASAGKTGTLYVFSDGTSGVGTITISSASTVIGTKSVTFYGAVASLTASVKKPVANTGSATTGVIEVIARDAAGIVVPSQGLTITSATTATVASYTATSSSAAEAAAGTASVSVTGVATTSGAVVLTIADTATKLVTTTATVTVSAEEAATVTFAFDKAEYAPGEKATLTITAKDKNGLAVAKRYITLDIFAAGGVTPR
jgi:trimeric autotransporter adhesin